MKPTLKIVTFSIHEDIIDQNNTEDAGPKMNITEHQHKANILEGKKGLQNDWWISIIV